MMEIIRLSDIKGLPTPNADDASRGSFVDLSGAIKSAKDAKERGGMKEIKLEALTARERKICRRDYINSIAGLGADFSSLEWWANAASEKNEHKADHYMRLCRFYALVKALKGLGDETVYVVCDDVLAVQLKAWCRHSGIKLRNAPVDGTLSGAIKAFRCLKTAFGTAIRMGVRKLYVHAVVGAQIRKKLDPAKDYYVMRSWVERNAIQKDRAYAKDSYFGRLPEIAAQRGLKTLVVAGILNNFTGTVRALKGVDALIVPEEYFLSFFDIIRALFRLRFKGPRLERPMIFCGADATAIYEAEIEKGYLSASYLKNLFRYYIAARFARSINFSLYIYTYENYAWEKMTVLGLRKNRRKARILAFQHAFVSEDTFKYYPGAKESGIIPLPDRIITMGSVTRDILARRGSYPPGVLIEGCALRHEYLGGVKMLERRRFGRVIVPLTGIAEQSALALDFLALSGLAGSATKVVIRCHPAGAPETFLPLLSQKVPDNFVFDNARRIQEELEFCDMVLYTFTTVSAEALRMGLPVIYLDVLSPMCLDPLFECDSLKKSVTEPGELVPAMDAFYNMPDDAFRVEQAGAQRYLRDYFYPVTQENLAPFFSL